MIKYFNLHENSPNKAPIPNPIAPPINKGTAPGPVAAAVVPKTDK